jgi:2-dehydro-3-deoxyglucarate aldolase/4-hydroxy-2-oxoheptanedioate aldolase
MGFEFAATALAPLAADAGADFIIYDMEHTGWTVETMRTLMATARVGDIVPAVRVPATEYHFIARILDVGAMGVMVPMVESAAQARRIVECAKYPPDGKRGTAFTVAHDDYTGGDIATKIREANAEGLVIAQIESVAGLGDVDAIAEVDGVDVLWIGHYDLTTSMGIPGEFSHTRYTDAVELVLDACERNGKAAGFMAGSVEQGRALIEQGFRCLAYSRDSVLYRDALAAGIAGLR